MSLLRDDAQPLVIAAEDVGRWIGPELALGAARRAAQYQLDPDTSVGRLTLGYPDGWMRVLGAAIPSLGVVGYKEFHLAAQVTVRYAIHLFAIDDGRPLGLVDGALITPLRTAAAATAAAVAYHSDDNAPLRLGVIGSGTEAEAGLRALAASLPLKSVTVTSRRSLTRTSFADDMSSEIGVEIEPVGDVEAVCERADIVYVSTASGGKSVVSARELDSVPLVLSIGSTLPSQRELDADVLTEASLIVVDTMEVLEESGDALVALEHGLERSKVRRLGEFLAAPSRPHGRTVYKSIGSAEQDVVLAAAVLAEAADRGFAQAAPTHVSVKRNRS